MVEEKSQLILNQGSIWQASSALSGRLTRLNGAPRQHTKADLGLEHFLARKRTGKTCLEKHFEL